jgi:hypothetical protein
VIFIFIFLERCLIKAMVAGCLVWPSFVRNLGYLVSDVASQGLQCHKILCAWWSVLEFFLGGWAGLEFELTKQALYHLSLISSPFCSGYFEDGVLQSINLGWPWTAILPISASQVARITGRRHKCPAAAWIFKSLFNVIFVGFIWV